MNFTETLAKWEANPRFADRKETKECDFSDKKLSPFWAFIKPYWENAFATSFMYNHKNYSITLGVGNNFKSDTEIAASIALPGKVGIEFDDLYELVHFIDGEEDTMKKIKSDKDIIFMTEEDGRPSPSFVNTTDKLVCYVNPHFGEIRVNILQFSPYRNLVDIHCDLSDKIDMRKVILPFISDEFFIIELIEKATQHFKKNKTTLSAGIKEDADIWQDTK